MTLLLGPPSSGKSTLLKALSGRLHRGGLKYQGEVSLYKSLCTWAAHRMHGTETLLFPARSPTTGGHSATSQCSALRRTLSRRTSTSQS